MHAHIEHYLYSQLSNNATLYSTTISLHGFNPNVKFHGISHKESAIAVPDEYVESQSDRNPGPETSHNPVRTYRVREAWVISDHA
jgi:hypothetical protein